MTNRKWEEGVVLEQHRDCLTKVMEAERTNVVSAEEDLSFMRIIDTRDQLEDCTFPRTIRSHNYL